MVHINEEQIAFYFEVGVAVTQWADVEYELSGVAAVCASKGSVQAMRERIADLLAGFFSIENFRTKLQYADTMVHRHLHGNVLLTDWATLHGRIEKSATMRNHLAHWPKLPVDLEGKPGRRIGIGPRVLKPVTARKIKPKPNTFVPPAGSLFLRDVAAARREFFALARSLENFQYRVAGLPTPFEASVEQAMHAPQSAQLVRQIRVALLGRPRPSQRKSKSQ